MKIHVTCLHSPMVFKKLMFVVLSLTLWGSSAHSFAEPIKIATSKSGWLLWIAEEKGFFQENDVEVELIRASSGVQAGTGIVDGSYDLGAMSEFAFVSFSSINPELRILSTIASIEEVNLVARGDRGIKTVSDLSHRTIGLRKKSISEFFLGQLLSFSNVDASTINIVDVLPNKLADWLAEGKGDAIVSWEPYAADARNAIGSDHVDFSLQGGQPYYFLLVGKSDTMKALDEQLTNLSKALIEANIWANQNEPEAQNLMSDLLEIPLDRIRQNWKGHFMTVSLPQDLLFLMEEELRWRIENGLSPDTGAPNYLNSINFAPLERVASERITIIR